MIKTIKKFICNKCGFIKELRKEEVIERCPACQIRTYGDLRAKETAKEIFEALSKTAFFEHLNEKQQEEFNEIANKWVGE